MTSHSPWYEYTKTVLVRRTRRQIADTRFLFDVGHTPTDQARTYRRTPPLSSHKPGISEALRAAKTRRKVGGSARERSSINLISQGIGAGDRRNRIASRPFGRRPSFSRQRPTSRLPYILTSPLPTQREETALNWFISANATHLHDSSGSCVPQSALVLARLEMYRIVYVSLSTRHSTANG